MKGDDVMQKNWLKIGSFVLLVVTGLVGEVSNIIERKTIIEELTKSKEVQKIIAKEVAKNLRHK